MSHRGFTLSFGAFQAYYQHELLVKSSASAISWIGTVQAWLLILVGMLSGPLFDLGYFRSMLYIGNFLVVFGIMMLSLARNIGRSFLHKVCAWVSVLDSCMYQALHLLASGFLGSEPSLWASSCRVPVLVSISYICSLFRSYFI